MWKQHFGHLGSILLNQNLIWLQKKTTYLLVFFIFMCVCCLIRWSNYPDRLVCMQCKALVVQYGPLVLANLDKVLDSQAVCCKAGFCKSSICPQKAQLWTEMMMAELSQIEAPRIELPQERLIIDVWLRISKPVLWCFHCSKLYVKNIKEFDVCIYIEDGYVPD